MVILGYHLAGEPAAPVAMMWGRSVTTPRLFVVPEPRERAIRFEALSAFATDLVDYMTTARDPQIVLANAASASWLLKFVGRFTRYLRIDGPTPAPMSIRTAGGHLTFLHQEYETPGSSTVLTAVDALTMHFRTGQMPSEDQNLAALLGWVRPGPGMTGLDSAMLAERTDPPSGPLSDPEWDRRVLESAGELWRDAAGDGDLQRRARRRLEDGARDALDPGWNQVWTTLGIMSGIPEASRVAARRIDDMRRMRDHRDRAAAGQMFFRIQPEAASSAWVLQRHERAAEQLRAEMVLDDPLLMAAVLTDEPAVSGTVIAVEPDHFERNPRRHRRPLLRIRLDLPTYATESVDLHGVETLELVVQVRTTTDEIAEVVIIKGANNRDSDHRIPSVGAHVVFSPYRVKEFRNGGGPGDTPWTHVLPQEDDPVEDGEVGTGAAGGSGGAASAGPSVGSSDVGPNVSGAAS